MNTRLGHSIPRSIALSGNSSLSFLSFTASGLLLLNLLLLIFFPHTLTSLTQVTVPDEVVLPPLQAATTTAIVSEPVPEVSGTSTIFFLGDVMLGRHVEQLSTTYGLKYPYEKLGFLTREPAYIVANFEAAIPLRHQKTPNFGYQFSVATTALPALRSAGVTHASLANNHSSDFGLSGYKHTVKALTDADITPFGKSRGVATSSVVVLQLGDERIGVLALHTLFEEPVYADIVSLLQDLEATTTQQIVYVHWGDEYTRYPNEAQQRLASLLAAEGVDIIIGHHPHVVQTIEQIGNTLVFYSLGNFIFDQYFSTEVTQGLVVKITNSDQNELLVDLLPITSYESPAQPRLMSDVDAATFLAELAAISQPELASVIATGQFIVPLASSSKTAIMNR